MKIKIPKKWATKTIKAVLSEYSTQYLGEEKGYVIFEDKLGIGLSREQLFLGARDFREFAKDIKVEGGTKGLAKNWLFLRPYRNKKVTIRLSSEMYELLKQYAKERKTTLTEIIVDFLGNLILQWQEEKKKSEKEESAVGYA